MMASNYSNSGLVIELPSLLKPTEMDSIKKRLSQGGLTLWNRADNSYRNHPFSLISGPGNTVCSDDPGFTDTQYKGAILGVFFRFAEIIGAANDLNGRYQFARYTTPYPPVGAGWHRDIMPYSAYTMIVPLTEGKGWAGGDLEVRLTGHENPDQTVVHEFNKGVILDNVETEHRLTPMTAKGEPSEREIAIFWISKP